MLILDGTDSDGRINAAATLLLRQVGVVVEGRAVTKQLVHDVEQLIYDHRVKVKQRLGVDFPELVVVALPLTRRLEICRRDLDTSAIDEQVRVIARKYPGITAEEIAGAIRRAWPHHRPQLIRGTA